MERTIESHSDVLMEKFPEELVDRSWRNYVLSTCIPCSIFCCFPLFVAAFDSSIAADGPMRWIAATGLSVMMLCFLALILLSTALVLHNRLRSNLPTVKLRAGELTLRCGGARLSADIRECKVKRGSASRMRISAVPMGITLYCWFPVILIHMPPFERTIAGIHYSRNIVAVGLTDSSLKQWENALAPFVGEPSDAPKDRASRFENGRSPSGPR